MSVIGKYVLEDSDARFVFAFPIQEVVKYYENFLLEHEFYVFFTVELTNGLSFAVNDDYEYSKKAGKYVRTLTIAVEREKERVEKKVIRGHKELNVMLRSINGARYLVFEVIRA